MKDPRKVLISHLISEKYSELKEEQNLYVFHVADDANKLDVKFAVENLFEVDVDKVRTMVVRGKIKRLGRFIGKRPNWKKAVVYLKKDQAITQLDAV